MNDPLLKQIAQAVADQPEKLNMSSWCGTACCIAGWAVILAGEQGELDRLRKDNPGLVSARAKVLLGIDTEQASSLFHLCCWPDHLHTSYAYAANKEAQAAVLRERIDHFIATGE